LIDSAKAGTPFGELAQRHRDGPSARRGGDLGTFSKERMVSKFAEAAYMLEEVGDVYRSAVRTEYGFQVIKLTETLQPMPMEQAQRRREEESKRNTVRSEAQRLLSSVTVRINSDGIPLSLEAAE
jgi:peptidyl-prolyl cis-trans isomerase C